MSSTAFRNAVRRREHRERHQPEARRALGLLEKHKDYVVRARNYHAKEARVAQLRKQAANRNPDEFYFGMLREATVGGIATKRRRGGDSGGGSGDAGARPEVLTADLLRVLKTQDAGYVRALQGAEERRVERMRASLQGTREAAAGGAAGRHTVFRDEEDEEDDAGAGGTGGAGGEGGRASSAAAAAARARDDDFTATDADAAPADRAPARKRRRGATPAPAALAAAPAGAAAGAAAGGAAGAADAPPSRKQAAAAAKQARLLVKEQARAYAELAAREGRVRKLSALSQHFDIKRKLLSSKGRRTKVADAQGDLPPVYKWKPVRAK
jgi:U3 small nucleolar RNA-associated protein 11